MPTIGLRGALALGMVTSLVLALQASAAGSTHKKGRPDLLETSVNNPPASVAPGEWFTETDVVKNRGRGNAHDSVTRYYLESGTIKLVAGSRPVASLKQGQANKGTARLFVPKTAAIGAYSVVACADAGNVVRESNETNNCRDAAAKLLVRKQQPPPPPLTTPPPLLKPPPPPPPR
jgi:subtilase family serine protease